VAREAGTGGRRGDERSAGLNRGRAASQGRVVTLFTLIAASLLGLVLGTCLAVFGVGSW
jgi:ABC-type amino acid transport system permease subunit